MAAACLLAQTHRSSPPLQSHPQFADIWAYHPVSILGANLPLRVSFLDNFVIVSHCM
ncbi:hypothetical protein AGR9A_Lc40109 [Agrobacterium salinitolerans str. Hayward 0363]|nr:hypothetical protein AGR9A_Lc40109 [Agrobacterium salinitolerans str. Hayward 0363]